MAWNLTFNGTPATLQVADPVTVQPSHDIPPLLPNSVITMPGDKAGDSLKPYDHGQRDREVFHKAGWRFIKSGLPTVTMAHPAGSPPATEALHPVFATDRGDLLIGTDVATVQLNAAPTTTEKMAERVLAEDGLTILHKLSFAPYLYAVRLPSKRSLPETINALQAKTHRYVFAEPSMLQRITGRGIPDADFEDQWQHAAAPHNGKGGFGLDSLPAWEFSTGTSQERPVRIAIIDNGMDIKHRDLEGAIVDGGFFTSDGPGAGIATFTRFTPTVEGFPRRGHGTLCLGMAGARRNNGNGGCGVAPDSELIALACARDQTGNQLTLARAIEFAVNPKAIDPDGPETLGADIISCSLRTASVLEAVLDMAIKSTASARGGLGIPLFWAVSNHDKDINVDKVCSHKTVIAVGRSNREGLPDGSAAGPELAFIAPGVDVLGPTEREENTINNTGTSFATPLAAGVAALVMARHPTWNVEKIVQRLKDTCDKPAVQDSTTIGAGRLNAHRAVQENQNNG